MRYASRARDTADLFERNPVLAISRDFRRRNERGGAGGASRTTVDGELSRALRRHRTCTRNVARDRRSSPRLYFPTPSREPPRRPRYATYVHT